MARISPAARFFPFFALLLLACPALTACQTDSPGASMAQAPPAKPMTRQEAALQCWMSVDKHKEMSVDTRADVVTKCIDDKMKSVAAAPKS